MSGRDLLQMLLVTNNRIKLVTLNSLLYLYFSFCFSLVALSLCRRLDFTSYLQKREK